MSERHQGRLKSPPPACFHSGVIDLSPRTVAPDASFDARPLRTLAGLQV
jgi:hypothetical protein